MKKVFVSGCYDILHGGHIEFFEQAKALGDHLTVSFAGTNVLKAYKNRKPSIPDEHKKKLIESIGVVDEAVIGTDISGDGLDFKQEFARVRPDILAVTEDDHFGEIKKELCNQYGAEYVVLPKTLGFKRTSTSEILKYIKAPTEVPVRVDFAGGWLDVPKHSREDSFIVNCAVSPGVTANDWPYRIGSGLGGSAARAHLMGEDSIAAELDDGVGWQDPAVIHETGLCVWRSGQKPVLDCKLHHGFLQGKMALLLTGDGHMTSKLTDGKRDYDHISQASKIARNAVKNEDIKELAKAVHESYLVQMKEGMDPLEEAGLARKYCGAGFGGYALYLFLTENERDAFVENNKGIKIEPYARF